MAGTRGLVVFCFSVLFTIAALTVDGDALSTPADDSPPMAFAVVRSAEPGCEPTCPEWISAEGAIVAATPARLKSLLKTLGGRKLPIVIWSPGGDVDAALALGRMIRQRKLDDGGRQDQICGMPAGRQGLQRQ